MLSEMDQSDEFWWRHGVFYQIYPRSFQDSNADGVGDIRGIVDRLPYLQALGIDAIWLSPISDAPFFAPWEPSAAMRSSYPSKGWSPCI